MEKEVCEVSNKAIEVSLFSVKWGKWTMLLPHPEVFSFENFAKMMLHRDVFSLTDFHDFMWFCIQSNRSFSVHQHTILKSITYVTFLYTMFLRKFSFLIREDQSNEIEAQKDTRKWNHLAQNTPLIVLRASSEMSQLYWRL